MRIALLYVSTVSFLLLFNTPSYCAEAPQRVNSIASEFGEETANRLFSAERNMNSNLLNLLRSGLEPKEQETTLSAIAKIKARISAFKDGQPSQESASKRERQLRDLEQQCQCASEILSRISNANYGIRNASARFHSCLGSPYSDEYLALCSDDKKVALDDLLRLGDGKFVSTNNYGDRKDKLRYLLESILETSQAIADAKLNVDELDGIGDSKYRDKFIALSSEYLKEAEKVLVDLRKGVSSSESQNRANVMRDASNQLSGVIQRERELEEMKRQSPDLVGSEFMQSYESMVGRQQEISLSLLDLLSSASDSNVRSSDEFQKLYREQNESVQASAMLREAMYCIRNFTNFKKNFNETLSRYPSLKSSDYPKRFDELVAKFNAEIQELRKALKEGRKALAEAHRAGMQNINEEFYALRDEASSAGAVSSALAYVGGLDKLQDDVRKRLEAAIKRCEEARERSASARREYSELNMHIRMLELKRNAVSRQQNELVNDASRARNELVELCDSISGRRESYAPKAKDLEDMKLIKDDGSLDKDALNKRQVEKDSSWLSWLWPW